MSRVVYVGAAQLGPIAADERRTDVVERLILLLRDGAESGCNLVVFPELALTTFFPRWYTESLDGHDHYYETEMPSAE
ncbi:MAG: N-carbamoyl-D-amino-acid hydrolase, partial [Actinomycetia bacterium]|nr:N-carbamoyl-D-amino-acid hydrolase [Actinomycetes bacterium]